MISIQGSSAWSPTSECPSSDIGLIGRLCFRGERSTSGFHVPSVNLTSSPQAFAAALVRVSGGDGNHSREAAVAGRRWQELGGLSSLSDGSPLSASYSPDSSWTALALGPSLFPATPAFGLWRHTCTLCPSHSGNFLLFPMSGWPHCPPCGFPAFLSQPRIPALTSLWLTYLV